MSGKRLVEYLLLLTLKNRFLLFFLTLKYVICHFNPSILKRKENVINIRIHLAYERY